MSYRDPETLRRLYHEEGKSAPEIAEEYDVTPQTIYHWMDEHGIERRSATQKHTRGTGRGGVGSDPVPLDINPSTGYWRWRISVDGTRYTVPVHRLVAVAEYGFDEVCGNVVHHENEMKLDNRHSNISLMDGDDHLRHHSPY